MYFTKSPIEECNYSVPRTIFPWWRFKKLENTRKIAYCQVRRCWKRSISDELNKYLRVTQINGKDITTLKQKLTEFNLVIIGLHKTIEKPMENLINFVKNELSFG